MTNPGLKKHLILIGYWAFICLKVLVFNVENSKLLLLNAKIYQVN